MNCDEAMRILTEPSHHLHQEAIDFVVQEPVCFERVDQFARAILSGLEDETTCAEVQTQLPHYYELERAQQNFAVELPIIYQHLERCPYCQTDYQMLKDAMVALEEIDAETENLTAGGFTPVFDLSFLPTSDTIWQLQDGIQRLFENIRISISATAALIADMGTPLQPEVFPATMRGGEDDAQYSVLILPDASAQIRFQLDSIPSSEGMAQIIMRIFETERDQPIQNVRVTLRRSNNELVAGSLTDADGAVEFSMLTADGYNIQAQYDGKTWELPITISQI